MGQRNRVIEVVVFVLTILGAGAYLDSKIDTKFDGLSKEIGAIGKEVGYVKGKVESIEKNTPLVSAIKRVPENQDSLLIKEVQALRNSNKEVLTELNNIKAMIIEKEGSK